VQERRYSICALIEPQLLSLFQTGGRNRNAPVEYLRSLFRRSAFFLVWLSFTLLLSGADLVPVNNLGLRVARGFRVTQYADADLANDIYAMTLDARGNPVVTGQGYIKTLFDTDGDGRADAATNFAQTVTGGMGMCFDGNDLYFCGDGFLSRYRDADGDGKADGGPENLLPLEFAEHGGHAMRKGPDGWWYVIAGNETHFTQAHTALPSSPIRQIEAGALLRLTPDGRQAEAIAHGFRNPYDFDFNWLGDIFTYDSDMEADFLLPWYSPTRVYHVGYAGHHGWRLEGWRRSWARPDYYADTVDILYSIGRGSPTGVTCYRHFQFPPYYRNGLFALDWTFGKVYFLPLQPSGASYRAAPEVFLESVGTHGFDPTDIVVTPDGSLLISIGGRKTRGAIYRVEYVAELGAAANAGAWMTRTASELEAVLVAPQPLDAWSRAFWMPVAARLGPEPFAQLVVNEQMSPEVRVRAVEILTEMRPGLSPETASAGGEARPPAVRARVAWSLGRVPTANAGRILLGLAKDFEPMVRRCALEALADQARNFDNATLQAALAANLAHPEKRVRQCAARLATKLPDPAWNALWTQQQKGVFQARLTTILASLWRGQPNAFNFPAVEAALSILEKNKIADQRLEAIRLMILGLGDYNLRNPSLEVYTAFELALPLTGQEALARKIRSVLIPLIPSGDAWVDGEASRLLAMLEDDSPELPSKIMPLFTARSLPGADLHYLAVLSKLKAPVSTNSVTHMANAILSLDGKLEGQEQRGKQNWTARLAEVVQTLLRHEPKLGDALLKHSNFARPAHIAIAASFDPERYLAAARLFAAAARTNASYPWSGQLIDLVASLPAEESFPLFRRQWANVALRDDILLKLKQKPQALDRERFIAGLSSSQPNVVQASLAALLELSRSAVGPASRLSSGHSAQEPNNSGETLSLLRDSAIPPTLRLLRRLESEPGEQAARAQVLALLSAESGQAFNIAESRTDLASLKRSYQPVFDWFSQKYPALPRQLDDEPDSAQSESFLKRVAWQKGDPAHGRSLFVERGCQICHTGPAALGPDLGGITSRFSVIDLFNAIIYPSRDVAPAYRTTIFHMRDGEIYAGLVAFESADGVIVQTSAATTVRLDANSILSRQPSDSSLMPNGLLSGLQPEDFADLYSYLKTLPPGATP